MSQPQALTTAQLEAYSQQLANGTMADVEQVYADLYSQGYNYAGWAGGVASESTIAGVSAVNFLTGTALMGWGGPQCRNLPEATLDSIRMQMAKEYVDVLLLKAQANDGVLREDVKYKETLELHETVFTNHNLILPVLEIFNGQGVAQAGFQNPVFTNLAAPDGSTQQVTTYTLFAEQVQLLLNAYEQLRQSVYGVLVMQTRLKPYLDAVELVIEVPVLQIPSNESEWRLPA